MHLNSFIATFMFRSKTKCMSANAALLFYYYKSTVDLMP